VPYILALDEGTTSARAIVFDQSGALTAVVQKEFPQIFPQTGWVEHDPQEIWNAQAAAAIEVLSQAHLLPRDIAAVGITNQRETTIVWDRKTGQAVYNAIVWQDRRTAALSDQLRADGYESVIQQRTGLLLDPYFSATKIAWILDNVSGARKRAEAGQLALGTVDSWLIWQLTGGRLHVTDVSNAARTLLLNIHTGQWDEELLRLFRIPASLLPEVRSSSEVYGEVTSIPELEGIPIGAIAGDQQAALFGQACFASELAKNTYGTGCFMLQSTGAKPAASRHRLLTTIAWKISEHLEYALEGGVFVGGAVVQWLRDGLGLIRSSAEIETLAASVADNGGVYLVPAFAGLGAPHWDPYARGTLVGLTRGTTAAHIARAALEGIAFQVADLLDAMQADAGSTLQELRVDGGAAKNNLLMQFQADLLGVPVVRPLVTETTALGAASLAGLSVGFWKNPREIAAQWRSERRFEPRMAPTQANTLRQRWSTALERAKNWEGRPEVQ
jgi:glycerol kinase